MTNCIVCGHSIDGSEDLTQKETDAGTATAHSSCLAKLRALLADVQHPATSSDSDSESTPFLERHGNDWILTKRSISVTTMMLAYLERQSEPCQAKAIYDWLDRNEVRCSNPAEYIRKMRNRGEISTLNIDGTRMIRLTRKGAETLKKSSEQHEL